MTTGLLLVAHGSASGGSQAVTHEVARRCAELLAAENVPVAAAFLDHDAITPTLGLEQLKADGATDAIVVPLLLGAAFHVIDDLPKQLSDALPHVISAHLGPHPAIIDALASRVTADAVVLVAAGTSDPSSQAETTSAAAQLEQRLGVPVIAAYASAAEPSPRAAAEQLIARGLRPVLLPYLLAEGRFSKQISEVSAQLGLQSGQVIGADESVVLVAVQRFHEALDPGHAQQNR